MKKENRKFIISILIFTISILIMPIIIKYFIIENDIFSEGSNDGWLSFFGSYVGGVFGGIGTIIALWFTRNDTKSIQDENKRLQKLENQKEFASGIAEDVARYLADVKVYFYQNENNRRVSNEIYFLLRIKLNRVSGCDFTNNYAYSILACIKSIEKYLDDKDSDIDKFEYKCKELIEKTNLFVGISNFT
ncbi:hypothetical protein ACTPDI_19565 [Clostridioides difficile]|nr:hypothetical protein [Clostridioides difficile]